MNLSETSAKLRPRSPYEAIDLGTTMVHHWWKELWFIWFAVSLPMAVVIWFALTNHQAWGVLALWWCKPLWETPLLHFVAEKLFHGNITPQSIIKRAPKLLLHDLFLKITLRRFSITRSFDMPVSELEKLSGTARNKRLNILHRTSSSAAIWLTIIGTHLESMIVIATFTLIWLFIPEHIALEMDIIDFLFNEDLDIICFIIGYLAMSAVGPFYVASGFCLYINRRTLLEGWDIELRFKQLRERIEQQEISKTTKASPSVRNAVIASIAVISFAFGGHSTNALAESMTEIEYTPKHSRNDIIEILESDDFNRIEEDYILRPKHRDLEPEDTSTELPFLKSLMKIMSFLAQSLEVILWGIFIAVIVFLLYQLKQYHVRQSNIGKTSKPVTAPDSLFGLDLRQESLPNDILSAAKQHWLEKEYREAYSLLYRGALIHIAHKKCIPLHESFTEEECVAQFQQHDNGLQPLFFAQLTQQWQMIAYGHQIPETTLFETTCDGWHFHFKADSELEGEFNE